MKYTWLFLALSATGLLNAQTKVQDVDNPGRNPVQVFQTQTTTGAYNEIIAYSVPLGYRLILEYAGGSCFTKSQLRGVQVTSTGAANAQANYRFPLNQNPYLAGYESYFATPVRAYVEAGQTVTINFFATSDLGTWTCDVSLSGYLVKP
jgi:hypothetical protein